MDGKFLRIFKDWFYLDVNPTELLILSQVAEYNLNNYECFESDEKFAKNFNVSISTISRAIKSLKDKQYLKVITVNTQGGRKRTLIYNQEFVEAAIVKMKFAEANSQNDNCGNVKLTFSNEQNDLIKDNNDKKSLKDNFTSQLSPFGDNEFHF